MKRIFIGDGPTDVPKYEHNLLSFGETSNMKFNRCFSKVFTEKCLLFEKLTCVRMEKISSALHQVRVILKKFISDLFLAATNVR